MCIIWKALCPYVLDARLGLWISLEHTITLRDAQVQPTSWLGGSTRGLQPGGHVHKEAIHLLSLQPSSNTSSGAFKPDA